MGDEKIVAADGKGYSSASNRKEGNRQLACNLAARARKGVSRIAREKKAPGMQFEKFTHVVSGELNISHVQYGGKPTNL